MPTAAEFNAAAAALEDMVPVFDAMWKALDGVALDLGMTPIQDEVVGDLDAAMTELGKGTAAIRATVHELLARAFICEQYAAALSDYRRHRMQYEMNPDRGAKPVRPVKPFPWVEEK